MGKDKSSDLAVLVNKLILERGVNKTDDAINCTHCNISVPLITSKLTRHFGSAKHLENAKWSLKISPQGLHIKRERNQDIGTIIENQRRAVCNDPVDNMQIQEVEVEPPTNSISPTDVNEVDVLSEHVHESTQTDLIVQESLELAPRLNQQDQGSRIANIFQLKPQDFDESAVASLKNYPFVTRSVENLVRRSGPQGNKRKHDPVIKATMMKFRLKHTMASALELSKLCGGPSKATLKNASKLSVPILDHYDENNIMSHLQKIKSILKQRNVTDVDTPWALSVDATATTGDTYIVPNKSTEEAHSNADYLVGADHKVWESMLIHRDAIPGW